MPICGPLHDSNESRFEQFLKDLNQQVFDELFIGVFSGASN